MTICYDWKRPVLFITIFSLLGCSGTLAADTATKKSDNILVSSSIEFLSNRSQAGVVTYTVANRPSPSWEFKVRDVDTFPPSKDITTTHQFSKWVFDRLDQRSKRQILFEYGFVSADNRKELRSRFDEVSFGSFLRDWIETRPDVTEETARQIECITGGWRDFSPLFLLAIQQSEIFGLEISQREDLPMDFNARVAVVISDRLAMQCAVEP